MPELATHLTCTGCGACTDVCPRSALAMVYDEEGFAFPKLDPSLCVQCDLCTRACPVVTPVTQVTAPALPVPFAGWSTSPEHRRAGSSGGVFTELAGQILAQGGLVAGVRTDGLAVCHDLAATAEEARRFQGSKYLQSETRGIYRRVLAQLKQGRKVLFSGTPCQVAGLANLAEGQRGRENLVTCEVLCLGVPSRRFWQRYVDAAGQDLDDVVGFRDKLDDQGSRYAVTLRARASGRTLRSSYDRGDVFLRAFAAGLIMRNSCYDCPFAAVPRVADITLGDFWGLHRFPEEHAKGVSLVIANSPSGLALLRSTSSVVLHPVNWAEALPANPRVYEGQSHRARGLVVSRRHLASALQRCSFSTLDKLYTGRIPKWQVWWWPYKLALRRCDAAVERRRRELQQMMAGPLMEQGAAP